MLGNVREVKTMLADKQNLVFKYLMSSRGLTERDERRERERVQGIYAIKTSWSWWWYPGTVCLEEMHS